MFEEHGDDAVEHFEVVESGWVGAGVVREEEPEEDEDRVLQGEGEPVDVAPGGVFGDDAGEEAGEEEAEGEAGGYD